MFVIGLTLKPDLHRIGDVNMYLSCRISSAVAMIVGRFATFDESHLLEKIWRLYVFNEYLMTFDI